MCAETRPAGSLPQSGAVVHWRAPQEATLVESSIGPKISAAFDSMIAKLIFSSDRREVAIERALRGLDSTRLIGVSHNGPLLSTLLKHQDFRAGRHHTRWLSQLSRAEIEERLESNEAVEALREMGALSALVLSLPIETLLRLIEGI